VPDFDMGAMENWGLVTFRDTNLLFDQQKSSLSRKESIAQVIVHETSHQVGLMKQKFTLKNVIQIDYSGLEIWSQ